VVPILPAHPNDRWLTESLRWRQVVQDGESLVRVSCADGHVADLSSHIIQADGTVKPSVLCPEPGCHWHEFVQLQEWEPDA